MKVRRKFDKEELEVYAFRVCEGLTQYFVSPGSYEGLLVIGGSNVEIADATLGPDFKLEIWSESPVVLKMFLNKNKIEKLIDLDPDACEQFRIVAKDM